MIVDASAIINAVIDSGSLGSAARSALARVPSEDLLVAPGHFPIELMSGLVGVAHRPGSSLAHSDIPHVLAEAERFEIVIEATPWSDVRRAWELSQGSVRYADALYVAAAERHHTSLLTADARIERSGAKIRCSIITI